MRIQINLAREPFRKDRPVLIGSAVVAALLLATLGLLISLVIIDRKASRDTARELAKVSTQQARVQQEQAKIDASMRQQGNTDVLDRSVFLNSLIFRKSISWTRIFADLEKVMPAQVRVVTIRPQVNAKNQITLDMTVAAENPEPVLGLIAKLETTDVFGSTSVSVITPPSQSDPVYRYRIMVTYAQKL